MEVLLPYFIGVLFGCFFMWAFMRNKKSSGPKVGHLGHTSKIKQLWLIWCRTVDHRIGKTDDDEPQIPILSLEQANVSLIFRTTIILINVITCLFIVANIIHKW
mgnify:CR=1 FL=1|tara:strand:+ start:44 stop:355 length:312 start_codon:yes stop_codon:yes gene_type:complete